MPFAEVFLVSRGKARGFRRRALGPEEVSPERRGAIVEMTPGERHPIGAAPGRELLGERGEII